MKDNLQITAYYEFFDERGELIDSSDQSGLMIFQSGQQMVLSAIESALLAAEPGDLVELELPPELAFGAHRPELVFEAVRQNLPPDVPLEPGSLLTSGSGDRTPFQLRVLKLTENGALLDGNHPLAGKTLNAKLTLLEVQPAAPHQGA